MTHAPGAPPPGAVHVVGAAIVAHGRCLATRRSAAMSAPLMWEFPGGKVEPGEEPSAALAREVREELALEIAVGAWLGCGTGRVGGRLIYLEVFAARCVAGSITLVEHVDHGWFGPDELLALDWPAADLPVLPAVVALLRRPEPESPTPAAPSPSS